jgi:hypothetical protein
MSRLKTVPSSILAVMAASFCNYPRVLKSVWLLTFMIAILHLVLPFLMRAIHNLQLVWCSAILMMLLTWFFYAAILYKAQASLEERPLSTKNALLNIIKRLLPIMAGNIIFLAIIGIAIILNIFYLRVANLSTLWAWPIIVPIVIDIILVICIYLAVPLIVVKNMGVLSAFKESTRLVAGNWLRTLIVLLPAIILIIVFALLNYGLNKYYTSDFFFVVDFIYQLLIYPLMVSTTLVVMHDLQLRQSRR